MDYIGSNATFDSTEKLRLMLCRKWGDGKTALVAMLNPSIGNGEKDDPTLNRLTGLLNRLGYGGYTVVNWSPYISSTPGPMLDFMSKVYKAKEGNFTRKAMKLNIEVVTRESEKADTLIAAWGNNFPASMVAGDALSSYTAEFLTVLMRSYNSDLMCFGVTNEGAPKHPLARGKSRIADNIKLMPWIGRHTRG